jgi:hypothetical protein
MIHTKIIVPVVALLTPHPDMSTKRVEGLQNNAERMNEHRKTRVPDDGTFGQLIASQSADKFKDRVNFTAIGPGDRDAADIYTMQRAKILKAYNKYNDGLDYAFAEKDGVFAKLFKDAVEAKASNWDEAVALSTLRFTGSRTRGRQVASIMGYWLTGDTHATQKLPEGSQVLAGGPYDISTGGLKSLLRSGLTQLLVQTGVLVTESGYEPTMLTKHNGRIKDLLERLSDPVKSNNWVSAITPDKSYCVWFVEDGQLKLETQIYTA